MANISSRRNAVVLVNEGRVTVNGSKVLHPHFRIDTSQDKVAVDGRFIPRQCFRQLYYFAIHKPRCMLCSDQPDIVDKPNTRMLTDLLKPWVDNFQFANGGANPVPRMITVGRLDYRASGLIFVTNDGNWCNKVLHPSSGITRDYVVDVDRPLEIDDMARIMQGCHVDGQLVQPVHVGWTTPSSGDPHREFKMRARVVVMEGKRHSVRHIFENAGFRVMAAKRTRVGGYKLPSSFAPGRVK